MQSIYKSNWITYNDDTKEKVWEYTKQFSLNKKVNKAILYSSAIGVYTASVNNQKCPVYHLAPGYTYYNKRTQYQETDITSLCKDVCNLSLNHIRYIFL